ncbi:MAG: histidine phosphatase family protein [Pseudomonadales bacterium]|nr:histidine phosphatase family protein [Pseudomonadales bacterium]
MVTTIYLIRHGEIDANVAKRWHGWTDSDLNDNGRLQAEKMGAHLAEQSPEISAIYSSPLRRTLDTARSLAGLLNLEPVTHDGLREWGIGRWEGQLYDVLRDKHKFFDAIANDLNYTPPDGESVNQVCARMVGAFEEIRLRHEGECLALVGHGAALAITLASLLDGGPMPFYQYHMDNTGITKLIWHDKPVVEFFNQREHLDDGAHQPA